VEQAGTHEERPNKTLSHVEQGSFEAVERRTLMSSKIVNLLDGSTSFPIRFSSARLGMESADREGDTKGRII
jgi:hypothetical protein